MPTTRKTSTTGKKTKATTTRSKPAKEDDLIDFEQFVSSKEPRSKGKAWLLVTLIVVIIALAGALFFSSQGNLQKEHKYQAVFLDSGQVYFAKVIKEDALSVYLEDVYYIQTESQIIPSQEEDGQDQVVEVPVLIKRGSELHQPSGWMQLNRDKIISIEEIGADSEVLKELQRQESL